MTLPRRLTVDGDAITQEPVAAVESLRGTHRHVGRTVLPANREVVLDGVSGNVMELAAEIDAGSAPMVELNVLRSPGREEFTPLRVLPRTRLPRPHSRHHGARQPGHPWTTPTRRLPRTCCRGAPETASLRLAPEEKLKLRVFVDRSRGGGVRQRPPVSGGAGLSRAWRQPRRVAAGAGGSRGAGVARRLAARQHLLSG